MEYVLFMFLLGMAGPHADYGVFTSLAECEKNLKRVQYKIAQYNSTAEEDKAIKQFAMACVPLKQAPRGISS